MDLQRTPLYEKQKELGARFVGFAGWEMPIQFTSLKEEHLWVRENVGLFDVSHMGEIFFRGDQALDALQYMTTNDVAKLEEGQAQYSLIPNENGGIVDDIIVYCLKKNQEYLVCVNAANVEKDFAHFQKYNKGAEIENESAAWAQIAVQGPKAISLLKELFAWDLESIPNFSFLQEQGCLIARTGYTGEDGCEIFVRSDKAVDIWQKLLSSDLAKPIGLGARDTLRTEMKFSLYGQEIDDSTDAYSAGLGWVVKLAKGDFLGKQKLEAVKAAGPQQHLIGLVLKDKGIPRSGYKVFSTDKEEIGRITSGTLSPSTGLPIGIAYVKKELASPGTQILVEIRGRHALAEVLKTPFLK